MDLDALLDRSRASDQIKDGLRALHRTTYGPARPGAWLALARPTPAVKVARVLCQLLDAEPELPIERVEIDGWSGCSDFTGVVAVHAGGETRWFEFVWNCRWRAMESGITDVYGFPDQSRAARQFGWRCFQRWRALEGAPAKGWTPRDAGA